MNPTDLKSSLHALIDGINDIAVLKAYLVLLSREVKSQDDFWHTIDDKTKAAIEEGLSDQEEGRHHDFFDHMKTTYGIGS